MTPWRSVRLGSLSKTFLSKTWAFLSHFAQKNSLAYPKIQKGLIFKNTPDGQMKFSFRKGIHWLSNETRYTWLIGNYANSIPWCALTSVVSAWQSVCIPVLTVDGRMLMVSTRPVLPERRCSVDPRNSSASRFALDIQNHKRGGWRANCSLYPNAKVTYNTETKSLNIT